MLKKRIIGSIPLKNNWVVQSINFNQYLPIGKLKYSVEFLDRWGIDELLVSDISASKTQTSFNYQLLRESTENINVPITAGGGIKNVGDMINVLKSGADKICINNSILSDDNIITNGSKTLGRQCIMVSIDVLNLDNQYKVFDHVHNRVTDISVIELAQKVVDQGAGELLIRSIRRDGMKNGYNIELLSKISEKVSVPIIAVGGYGIPKHIIDCFNDTNISACAIGNELNYTEHSVTMIKSYLRNMTNQIRHETEFKYLKNIINSKGRASKYQDDYLENLIFKKITKLKI